MSIIKKLLLPLFAATALLTGCAKPGNTLNINPVMTQPQRDPALMGITISVGSADQRQDSALAKVNRDGQLITLYPSRDLRFLMQEVLEKQMTARGYMIGGNGIELKIIINQLSANVQEGNLRFNISSTADITVQAEARNGSTRIKNYRANYNVKGPLTATNAKITEAIETVLNDVISDMSRDTNIHEFIKQNAR